MYIINFTDFLLILDTITTNIKIANMINNVFNGSCLLNFSTQNL